MFVNGKEITDGKLAPYICNPKDILYYDRYDLTELLDRGENVVGVWLGNGFLNNIGGQVWQLDRADYRSAPKFACSYSEDGALCWEADGRFVTHPSPIIYDDLREGEHYDARREVDGWSEKEFDDSAWKSALFAADPGGAAAESAAPPVRSFEEYAPTEIRRNGDGYIYVFPFNVSGACRLKICGKEGQKVVLRYFETLDDDGNPFYRNIGFEGATRENGAQTDIYFCNGKPSVYEPSFTYHGFRYVYVEGITPEQAVPELLTCCFWHSDVKKRGDFSCRDAEIEKLQDMVVRSDLSNLLHIPTDCPHREKNGWTADAALSAHQMFLNFDMEGLFAEWLRNVRLAQREDGALPGIVPTAGWGYDGWCGPAWDCALCILPYEIYRFTGDTAAIRDNADALVRYADYLKTKINERGLIAFGLGDWCQAGVSENDGYTTPLEISDSVVAADICEKSAYLLNITGDERAKKLAAQAERLRGNIKERWVEGSACRADSQTAQALLLAYGYFDDGDAAAEELVRRISLTGHIGTGVVGGFVLFDVLSRYGYSDLAYRLITQKTPPSYGYISERGCNTLWEKFYDFGDRAGNAFCTDGKRVESLNHHFWGFISSWFYEYVAGLRINPECSDPNEVYILPAPPDRIDRACASRILPAGKVAVEWERAGAELDMVITVPEGARVFFGEEKELLPTGVSRRSRLVRDMPALPRRQNGGAEGEMKGAAYTFFVPTLKK